MIIDGDGDVAVLAASGSEPDAITDGASEQAAYFQPVWAPGSDLIAWGQASSAGSSLVTALPDGEGRLETALPAAPFYFYWSPDGARIAALHNGVNGVELKIVEARATTGIFGGSGLPLYISWSPDSRELVAHIGSDRLVEIDVNGISSDLRPTAAGYQAPQWSPRGIVHLAEGGLRAVDDSGDESDLVASTGAASFVLNPQGSLLAIQTFAEDAPGLTVALGTVPSVRPNIVAVVDLETGSVTTAADERSIGFFWSPDGEKLLMLHPTGEPGVVEASVWADGATRRLARFTPEPSFIRDVLPFFNQYAQSYQVWSPDSRHFAFAGVIDGEEGIWVQAAAGGQPALVARGTWVAFSDR